MTQLSGKRHAFSELAQATPWRTNPRRRNAKLRTKNVFPRKPKPSRKPISNRSVERDAVAASLFPRRPDPPKPHKLELFLPCADELSASPSSEELLPEPRVPERRSPPRDAQRRSPSPTLDRIFEAASPSERPESREQSPRPEQPAPTKKPVEKRMLKPGGRVLVRAPGRVPTKARLWSQIETTSCSRTDHEGHPKTPWVRGQLFQFNDTVPVDKTCFY